MKLYIKEFYIPISIKIEWGLTNFIIFKKNIHFFYPIERFNAEQIRTIAMPFDPDYRARFFREQAELIVYHMELSYEDFFKTYTLTVFTPKEYSILIDVIEHYIIDGRKVKYETLH